MREMPHTAASPGARVAAADAGDAGRCRTAAVALGAIPGDRAALDAMDLGPGFWIGGNGRVCALYRIRSALAAAIGAGGIRRIEPAEPADFSGRLLERMAVHADTS